MSRAGEQSGFPGGPRHLREADSAIECVYWAGETVRAQRRLAIVERTPEEITGEREMVIKEPDCTMVSRRPENVRRRATCLAYNLRK